MLDFYRGRTVMVTGHTGFKGTWLCTILIHSGAKVIGFSLDPPTVPSLFSLTNMAEKMISIKGDVRDYESLFQVFKQYRPEIVFHLAAQPLVRESYNKPKYTYETNVLGTVNVCECVRNCDSVKSFVNVTTDKVYQNNEWDWGYREDDKLDGYDPYSNSKSCSELVTHSYKRSFFDENGIAVSTARAGNVIGGGDFAADRIIPDCMRAALSGNVLQIRNINSVRPYQHVLEPLYAYLMIAKKQYEDIQFAGYYNVGPDETDSITTGELVNEFCECWNSTLQDKKEMCFETQGSASGPHEANYLKLDCSRIHNRLGWHPRWTVSDAIERTVDWILCYKKGGDIYECMVRQIREYFRL